MKRTNLLLSLLTITLTLAIAGCVTTSVYPYYFEKDVRFEPALVGEWVKEPTATDHYTIERDGENCYRMTYTRSRTSQAVLAHAFGMRGELFLDLFSGETKDEGLFPTVPSHLLVRVTQLRPTLRLTGLNYAWVEKLLNKNPEKLAHVTVKDNGNKRLILTASTRELQRFVLSHLKTPEAWEEELELLPSSTRAGSQ